MAKLGVPVVQADLNLDPPEGAMPELTPAVQRVLLAGLSETGGLMHLARVDKAGRLIVNVGSYDVAGTGEDFLLVLINAIGDVVAEQQDQGTVLDSVLADLAAMSTLRPATGSIGDVHVDSVPANNKLLTIGTSVYEWDTDDTVVPPRIRVDISGLSTAGECADALAAAISYNTDSQVYVAHKIDGALVFIYSKATGDVNYALTSDTTAVQVSDATMTGGAVAGVWKTLNIRHVVTVHEAAIMAETANNKLIIPTGLTVCVAPTMTGSATGTISFTAGKLYIGAALVNEVLVITAEGY
jgi:hypothetical protein